MNDLKYHIKVQIVKRSNGEPIPSNEPIFFLRARDYLALPILYSYRLISERDGCTIYHLDGIDRVIGKFEQFKKRFPKKMKQPGVTCGT